MVVTSRARSSSSSVSEPFSTKPSAIVASLTVTFYATACFAIFAAAS